MILATTKVENVDQFLEVFGTKGAAKREEHGSKGSTVFRDPSEKDRVWAIFDWDAQGWQRFVSDPEVPPILKPRPGTSGSHRRRRSSAPTAPSGPFLPAGPAGRPTTTRGSG